MSHARMLRDRIEAGQTVWMAGAYDVLSARLVADAGFDAVFSTGFGVSASLLGEPDVELYTMTENVGVVRAIGDVIDMPLVADADTGYGNVVNIVRTVRAFERAGAAAMIFEDQVVPKRCPVVAGALEILPIDEATAKIRAAVDARRDPDTIIVARTDAETMDECIRRGQAYAEAGADLIQPISRCVKSKADLVALRQAVGKPLSLQILGWLEDELSPEEIAEVAGFATFPLVPLMTATQALVDNLSVLARDRSTRNLPRARTQPQVFKSLIGYSRIEELQDKYIRAR